MRFDTRVQGIPCEVKVTYYTPTVPALRFGHPDRWMPEEPAEFEYELYDRKGYRAKWLERKVTDKDDDNIFEEYLHILTTLEEDYREEDYDFL